MFTINDDITIDVDGDLDISYEYMNKLPSYIKFNRVNGDFACFFDNCRTIRINGPKLVEKDYKVYYKCRTPLNERIIRKYCDVKGNVEIIDV